MFEEFKNKYLGKSVDIDNNYGSQCVDLFNQWNEDYNNCRLNCLPSGYAKSLAENKENNGILNYFTETTVDNMILGTVVVYGDCSFAPQSHVCFFIEDNGNGTYKALQQNYLDQPYVTIDNNPYTGIIGAFIPNQLLTEEEKENNSNNSNEKEPCVQYLNLNPDVTDWNIYPMDVAPIVGNECGDVYPSRFGGLSYTIKGYTYDDVAIIETRDYGKVQIYIGLDIFDKFSITNKPLYGLVK